MIRLGLVAVFTAFLAAPALAGPVSSDANHIAVAAVAPERTAEARPASKRRRLSTSERWRGKPYLRTEDSLLRGQALDKALPPVDTGFGTNGALGLSNF